MVGREIPIFIFHLMGWGNYEGHLLPYVVSYVLGKRNKENSCLHLQEGDDYDDEDDVHLKT